MSPTIAEVEGIEISIKLSEHGNPHIHAWYQGQKVKVFIKTLGIESGGLPPNQMKKLRKWIRDNREHLLRQWDAITNSP
ncbi:DUF4160 domain-containing protein [Desulfomonile tiedjei]|uniref:DUF4160 domain-containing protein n=1 Tax=Desulfomonile tiedjei (strain ATCC 49306 / DSM 6799 / DCB-1) TaxID=706587 RepID=I4CCH6_DESTA|nr:DUF4160 domain-containing protein [Desulfomonile tiedjei]AFM27267.1 hypothetical protein Desti_4643 [Desulfomonile tiedjei DSM 6799]